MRFAGTQLARIFGMNPVVHQAVGMIAVQIGERIEAAAMRLLVEADAEGRSPGSVAADVVARRKRFAPDSAT